jgi:hypothetical protein
MNFHKFMQRSKIKNNKKKRRTQTTCLNNNLNIVQN